LSKASRDLIEKMKLLKTLYGLGVVLSILLGFFVAHGHPVFPWHEVPSFDAIFGGLGALFLLFLVKGVGAVVCRKEGFYD